MYVSFVCIAVCVSYNYVTDSQSLRKKKVNLMNLFHDALESYPTMQ